MKSQVFAFIFLWVVLAAQSIEQDCKLCGHDQRAFALASLKSDPTPDQQKMDVSYYGLELDIRPDSNFFAGSVLIRASIQDTSITNLEFDLRNDSQLVVESATLNGVSVSFDHSGDLVRIAMPAAGPKPTSVEVRINYTCGPLPATDNRPFNFDSHLGQDLIWTMSQPFDARAWWPCKDYPADKPDSMDIRVTVPGNMTVVSNGRLVAIQDGENGRKTFHWHEGYPIATYLVSLAIYPYFIWGDEYVSAAGDTMPIEFYTFTDPASPDPWYLTSNYLKTKDMLYTFVELFGEYPFLDEKYGHAEWGLSYGMEHQTITSMGNPTERRVAHELAHQWWGNMITCATYQHMWLNEGFATYAEALWFESTGGATAYQHKMNDLAYYGPGIIYIAVPNNSNVFHWNLEYAKGAWVLHMLRHVVGDSTFFQILKTYGDNPQYKYGGATTEQFREVCEQVSGKELGPFFEQWIYRQYYPAYSLSWQATTDSIHIIIEQVQPTGTIYQMPVDLQIVCVDTSFVVVVQNTLAYQQYALPLPAGQSVRSVYLDPDNWILKQVEYLEIDIPVAAPAHFRLYPVYPNPFNGSTTIAFELGFPQPVHLGIYNLAGKLIWSHERAWQAGHHRLVWNGADQLSRPVASGTYLVRLTGREGAFVQKMILLK